MTPAAVEHHTFSCTSFFLLCIIYAQMCILSILFLFLQCPTGTSHIFPSCRKRRAHSHLEPVKGHADSNRGFKTRAITGRWPQKKLPSDWLVISLENKGKGQFGYPTIRTNFLPITLSQNLQVPPYNLLPRLSKRLGVFTWHEVLAVAV